MNPIVLGIGKKALDLFYKKFGKRIVKTVAESKWMANTIRLLKQKAHNPKTSDVVKKVHEGLKKDKPFHEGFTPKIVKPKIQTTRGLGDLWPRQLEKILKTGKYKKVPTPSGLKPPGLKKSNVIPFPKKPPTLKADGGSVDKALPKRSRDI